MRRPRRWRHHHGRHHGPPSGDRRFLFAGWLLHGRMRRRIFVWFGVAIALSCGLAGWIMHASHAQAWGWALVAAGAVLWAASGAIAWRFTRPLMDLIRVTRDLGDGKLASRLELGRHPGELGVLADAVNDMAARIDKQVGDQRELLAAVSHELRTPLGHLRILVDTARARAVAPALVGEIEREILELDALVGQLLAHSRLEFETLERRRLDGAELAALALERAGIDAARLDVACDDRACDGDPTLLARALANLLDNAAHHGGGVARLGLRRDGAALVFEVDDVGPGFAAGETARVFERFHRGERKAAAPRASLGLGLYLVERIARAHGGRAFAENRDSGGARVGFTVGG